jgi:glycosyltransferase involved in cell wall biosynthesis
LRIAIVTWSRQKVGGTEAYLESVIPELLDRGHQLAFWSEAAVPPGRDQICLPNEVAHWCAKDLGARRALKVLRDWHPDVIYCHSIMKPKLEAGILEIAPAVFFAHAYYGTCISGAKMFKSPAPTPCSRRFGLGCLLHYYPHRCGGLNPITMLKLYRLTAKRLQHLSRYKAVVTHSKHMRNEYLNNGLEPARVHNLSYYPHQAARTDGQDGLNITADTNFAKAKAKAMTVAEAAPVARTCWRLTFLGRMDFLKGGRLLIDALPLVGQSLNLPLHVTFAGDGPERKIWERRAARLQAENKNVTTQFVGWVKSATREALFRDSDLMVLPSVWPEPFGLVGPEAGLRKLPIVAFDVGGISDWLWNGVNGYLAKGDPPTSQNLAEAIIKCLNDPTKYESLRLGALEVAQKFKMENHLRALLEVLENAAGENESDDQRVQLPATAVVSHAL